MQQRATTCTLSDASFEEKAKVSNRAFYLSESGKHEQAIECYLALLESGEWGPLIYEDLSISYSKTGMCSRAEDIATKYIEWARRDWIRHSDNLAAAQGDITTGGKDWADFSKRLSIKVPFEEVEDPQIERILTALKECKKRVAKQ